MPPRIPESIRQQVEGALAGLDRFVECQLTPRNQKQLFHVQRHIHFCLQHLLRQHESLREGLDHLERVLWPRVVERLQKDSSPRSVATLLQHVFVQLLRLHDGLILCISGECRHPVDSPHPQFPSQLPKAGLRADGYTKTYDQTYTGTGWDELYDPTVGLWIQLYQLLTSSQKKRAKPFDEWWEQLVERRAPALEILLQQIETLSTDSQQKFVLLSRSFSSQLQRTLPNCHRAALKLDDKLESWHVHWNKRECKLGRYASDFQLQKGQGHSSVLADDWKTVMALPATANARAQPDKKRRRIVLDSDDEDGSPVKQIKAKATKSKETKSRPTQPKPDVNAGLKVMVRKVSSPAVTQSNNSSIRTIKEQFGVNVEALATSREFLEQEEHLAMETALVEDEAAEQAAEIQEAVRQVKSLKTVLKQVLRRNRDDLEIWSARECLREASMEAGNKLLWSKTSALVESSRDRNDTGNTGKALTYFRQAQKLVEAQQEALSEIQSIPHEQKQEYQHSLQLLHGQATVNVGIAQVEQGSWRSALPDLEQAAKTGHSFCKHDITPEETEQGKTLVSLSYRWLGIACWRQGRLKQAVEYLERSARDAMPLEAYIAWTTLAHLASEYLEKATATQVRECPSLLEQAFGYALEGIRQAISASQLLHGSKDAEVPDDTLTEKELLQIQVETEKRWKSRKELLSRKIKPNNETAVPVTELPRTDVLGDGPLMDTNPSSRLVWNGIGRQNKRKKNNVKGSGGYGNIGPSNTANPRPTHTEMRKYRPWGDELLPHTLDKKTGKRLPKLGYPCIAPEIPPDLAALVAQWQ